MVDGYFKHAYLCLKPGGRLVSIASGSIYNSWAKSILFRQWLKTVNAHIEQLPAGSFLDSDHTTGINTFVIAITKELDNHICTNLN